VPRSYIYANLIPDGRVYFLESDPWGKIIGEEYDPAKRTVAHLGVILPERMARSW
jgi:hypothetical protein